jgi:hypothetical protein
MHKWLALSVRISALAVAAALFVSAHIAMAATTNIQTCTDFTVNNSSLNQDVTQGDTAAMLGTLRAASGSTCGDAISPTPSASIEPTVGFQISVVPGSNPVAYGTCSTGGGFGGQSDNGTWVDPSWFTEALAPNPDVIDNNGEVLRHLMTSGFAVGSTYGFRAHHDAQSFGPNSDKTNYDKSSSPCIDVHIVSGGTTPCGTYVGALPIVDQASGDGTPPPGTTGPWSFRITIWACNEDIVLQSAQGGSSGWTTFDSIVTTPPAKPPGCVTVKQPGASSTVVENCIWAIQQGKKLVGGLLLTAGNYATIQVTEHANSPIPASAPSGQTRCLNGPWSALYTDASHSTSVKSPYTDRAAVVVANPDDLVDAPGVIGCN